MNISLTRLKSFYSELAAPLLLQTMIRREFPGSIAVLTSPSRNSGLLLSLAAQTDPAIPVLFYHTGEPERHAYAAALTAHLGLQNVRHMTNEPLEPMLEELGLLALLSDRKSPQRFTLDENGVFHIHPLAGLATEALNSLMMKRDLPPYPLAHEDSEAQEAYTDIAPETVPDWNL